MPTLRLDAQPLPVVGRARVYVCGITPYDTTHLGHAATFVWADVAVRVLREVAGVDVLVCRNVTDVDDDMLAAARRAGVHYDQLAAVQQFQFDRDMAALGVRRADEEPRAHQHVAGVVRLAAALLDRGHAYERDGSVYFRGAEAARGNSLPADALLEAARAGGEHIDDPNREDPLDPVVWQAVPTGSDEPAWPSPWGPGRPGWHSECAAMALTVLGSCVDLHAGGADLAFPHHAYESAQAEAVTGVRPFARAWLRAGTVRVDGAKMAKSAGNLVLVSDVLAKHRPAALRLALLDRRWRDPWDYTARVLDDAEQRLDELFAAAGRPGDARSVQAAVDAALLDDLDVPAALDLAIEHGGDAARRLVRVLAVG